MDKGEGILMNKIDYDFSKYKNAVRSSVGVAIRVKYFDELTADFIQKHKNPIVVNVGCGLDTRYKRLGPEITGNAVFYELDIPEAIELRERFLHESENDIYLKGSIFETDWMDELKDKHPQAPFLFVAEGVLMYFEKERVKRVFVNLSERFSTSQILFDVTSSWMCKNSHRHDSVKHTNAPFKLALDDDKEIEDWAKNLKLESVRHFGDFKEWKRCGFMTY
jgi:O-methyltransferase involved in polyketide biosynthesis